MTDLEKHIRLLFAAELQFRLASAVNLATTLKMQPLDFPTEWIHGKHSVKYEEIALRPDQADYAAWSLQRSAAFLLMVATWDAIRDVVDDPKNSSNPKIRAAYQIARTVRNAFSHSPLVPKWNIDIDCQNKVFEIPDTIMFDTTGLHETNFEWRHVGGPLALFRLGRFVRSEILGDNVCRTKPFNDPTKKIIQQGNLLLISIDTIPAGAIPIEPKRTDDGGYIIGSDSESDYVIYPGDK